MYRFALRSLSVIVPLVAGTVMLAAGQAARAQAAAPAAAPAPAPAAIAVTQLAPGVTAEVFAAAPSAAAPGQTVYVARFVFKSGAAIFPHSHPGTTVLGVVSGTFGWTLKAGVAHVIRGAAAGASGPVEDLTKPDTDVILKAGDAIFYESDVVHTARGAGDTDCVVQGSLVLKAGAPLLMPADMKM